MEYRTIELSNHQKALLNLDENLNEKSIELVNKTELLQLANKELEAFSYSVSHDLRAPLRAINGFVSILIEDYSSKLDDKGKRICSIIQSNASKMGQLIDDLLSFSRLIRSEIKQSNIDMEYLIEQTIQELSSQRNKNNLNLTLG
ncbi:MAG: histidine kinase dimerization/phospho-acceptor domain-containing protein [Prolixibacteraceae bacterium]